MMLISLFLAFSFLFLAIPVMPINVYAEEPRDRMLTIESKVDPRVSAQQLSVTLVFYNMGTGACEDIVLTPYQSYGVTTNFPAGDYTLLTGMVSNDVSGYYIVSCDDFSTYAAMTNITVVIGNPEYDGEVEKADDYLVGAIDKEGTNELREKHKKPTIDWDEVERQIEEGYYDLDSPKSNIRFNEDGTPIGSTKPSVSPSASANTTIPTSPDEAENTKPEKETIETTNSMENKESTKDEIISKEENNKHIMFSILFVGLVIVIAGISIYYRNKNANIDE